jgi:thiol-disulfide isomerase/thioredoxin
MRFTAIVFGILIASSLTAALGIVEDVRAKLGRGDFAGASASIQVYRRAHGTTPEAMEAMSWVARIELAKGDRLSAEKWALDTYQLAVAETKQHPLNNDPNAPLALALGAAIEVEGNVKEQQQHAAGVAYLRQQLQLFSRTSIGDRIQKNVNLLSLVGNPAPPLRGATIPKGKVALLFFWAHWCPDCKAEADVLRKLKTEFTSSGLILITPTQHYGYAAGGEDASPEAETRYIEQVRQHYYAGVVNTPLLVNEENFLTYGASTTPTLVLVDRNGIVRMYHPGALSYQDLRSAIRSAL